MQLFVKHLLTEALSKSVNDGIKELNQKLNVTDEVEKQLLNGAYDWGSPNQQNDIWNIFLLRSSKTKLPPETIEVSTQGRPFIRLTRIFTDVERPTAIMTRSRISGGYPTQSELFLVYDQSKGWQVSRPSVKKESMQWGIPSSPPPGWVK
jgi:hypothetical protein